MDETPQLRSLCSDRRVTVLQAASDRGPSSRLEEGRSGWSSRLAVRTGRLRRSLVVHVRPIDLVVFQEPTRTSPLETSSRRGLRA